MDKKTKIFSDIFTFIMLIIVSIITIQGNYENQINIVILSIIILGSFLFRTLIVYEKERYNKFKIPSILIELFIALLIFTQDKTNVSQIYLIILIVDVVFHYSLRFSIFFTFIAYIFFLWRNFHHFNYAFETSGTFLLSIFVNALGISFIFFLIYFLKLQIQQKQLLAETMRELEYKNNKLKETSKALEEVTIIKERNRIAHEIHDTVGHTLTTVLIEMEACKRLIDVNNELAKEKLMMAQGQVRKGLNDIRTSVRLIKNHEDIIDFPGAIKNIIMETQKHTEVNIEHEISLVDDIPPVYKKMLIRALQEGLTNGIRHGKSTDFNFFLIQNQECLNFILKDNGSGTDKINLGFGLQAMKERVDELQGSFNVSSSKGNGFTIKIELPIRGGAHA